MIFLVVAKSLNLIVMKYTPFCKEERSSCITVPSIFSFISNSPFSEVISIVAISGSVISMDRSLFIGMG